MADHKPCPRGLGGYHGFPVSESTTGQAPPHACHLNADTSGTRCARCGADLSWMKPTCEDPDCASCKVWRETEERVRREILEKARKEATAR